MLPNANAAVQAVYHSDWGRIVATLIRSFADFRKRFYPKPVERDIPELLNPEEVGAKLAKESLDRLQAALSAK